MKFDSQGTIITTWTPKGVYYSTWDGSVLSLWAFLPHDGIPNGFSKGSSGSIFRLWIENLIIRFVYADEFWGDGLSANLCVRGYRSFFTKEISVAFPSYLAAYLEGQLQFSQDCFDQTNPTGAYDLVLQAMRLIIAYGKVHPYNMTVAHTQGLSKIGTPRRAWKWKKTATALYNDTMVSSPSRYSRGFSLRLSPIKAGWQSLTIRSTFGKTNSNERRKEGFMTPYDVISWRNAEFCDTMHSRFSGRERRQLIWWMGDLC